MLIQQACSRTFGADDMPTRNVVLSEHQERELIEEAKLKTLKQAARQGWTDVSAGRYADVADDQLEDFVGQLGRRAARQVKTAS